MDFGIKMLRISPLQNDAYLASSVLSIDLTEYVFAISEALHPSTDQTCLSIYERFAGISGAWLAQELFDKAFNDDHSSQDIKQSIKQLPIYRFLFDAYVIELVRNAMDECLMAYFESHRPCQIQFIFGLKMIDDHVFFEFKDNGRGFPQPFLDRLSNDVNKAQYVCEQDSFRREHRHRVDIKTFGGQGIGLRQLISWVQCGLDYETLRKGMLLSEPRSKQVIADNMASNFSVEFSNTDEGGAVIKVKAPKCPSVVRDKCVKIEIAEGLSAQEMKQFFGELKKPVMIKKRMGLTLDLTR